MDIASHSSICVKSFRNIPKVKIDTSIPQQKRQNFWMWCIAISFAQPDIRRSIFEVNQGEVRAPEALQTLRLSSGITPEAGGK